MNEASLLDRLGGARVYREAGKVTKSLGLLFEAHLPGAGVGAVCRILPADRPETSYLAEVVGFRDKRVLLMPFEETQGVSNDALVVLDRGSATVHAGASLLGRVIDGMGRPLDGKGPLPGPGPGVEERALYRAPSHPLERALITEPLDVGIRAINGLLTIGKGQRVGIMAGSGVGKSVLLGMMARHTSAHVNVIGLIGERGREVREFLEYDLGAEGLARSVVVVSTSDRSALERMRGAFLATAVAEHFRDRGQDVLLMMDSVTRFCMAQREIGLALGEPPASKGYTPSVFSTLPKLLERAGMAPGKGSITGLYTVLVEGDDMDDPIADATRSILDGHLVLSRKLAHRNHYPALDVLQSASRVMPFVADDRHRLWAGQLREWMATYQQVEDLINVGAYVRGSNPKVDQAIAVNDRIQEFLRQDRGERADLADALGRMHGIVRAAEAVLAK